MLKKLAPILSVLLITSNVFANQPAQEETSLETQRILNHEIARDKYITDGLALTGFTVCLAGLAQLNRNKLRGNTSGGKKSSVLVYVINNKAALSLGALSGCTALLALSCFASATLPAKQTAAKSQTTTELTADAHKENNTKDALTA